MKRALWIDASRGISGERFAAALIGLGVAEQEITRVIKSAAEELGIGLVDAHAHLEFLPNEDIAYRLHVIFFEQQETFGLENAPAALEKALSQVGVKNEYADFARRALAILDAVGEDLIHAAPPIKSQTIPLPIIGNAHTPYQHKAPYQPSSENVDDGTFYIDVSPEYMRGLQALETFNHIFVLSYLDRSLTPEITVRPPWKDGKERYGIFATRSPNRPSPIGLTRTRLQRIEGTRIFTGPLDLFDGTPILDIKPFISTLDGLDDQDDDKNDGWLEGSDHLELHRLGKPHTHPGSSESLFQLQTFIAILVGIGWGLEQLEIDLSATKCAFPVYIDPEYLLEPAVRKILKLNKIPYESKPNVGQSLSLAGAAILAALAPEFSRSDQMPSGTNVGLGLGELNSDAAASPGALRLLIE
jgi:tRNA-Thr(GGU) m(6)t(6)A37 methyltransferase TsaA